MRQPDYAVKGESYTKSESDNKYQPKGSYQTSGYSYSKAESDGRYEKKEQRKAGEKLVVPEMPAAQYPCQKMSEVSNSISS